MTRQRDHADRRKSSGYKRLTVFLEPDAIAALAQLRARGAKSDAAAVNAAVVGWSQMQLSPDQQIKLDAWAREWAEQTR